LELWITCEPVRVPHFDQIFVATTDFIGRGGGTDAEDFERAIQFDHFDT
jgi:hypothetical protein